MKSNPIQYELGALSIYWLAAKLLQWEQLKIGKLSNGIFIQPSQYATFNAMCSKHCASLQFWCILGLERQQNKKVQQVRVVIIFKNTRYCLVNCVTQLNLWSLEKLSSPIFYCLSVHCPASTTPNQISPSPMYTGIKALYWARTTKQVPRQAVSTGGRFPKKMKNLWHLQLT